MPRPCLIWRIDALDNQSFQSTLERGFEHLVEAFRVINNVARLWVQDLSPADHVCHHRQTLEQRSIQYRFTVAIHDIEHHRLDWEFGCQLADAMFAPSARGLLERQEFL